MSRRSAVRNARTDSFEVFTLPQRSVPARVAGLLLRFRAEITVVVVLTLAWRWLDGHLPRWAAITVAVLVIVAVAAHPASRRYVGRRAYAVLARHRLRAVLVQCRVITYRGDPPLFLWSRPTEVGERVWLLMRAGLDLAELENLTGHIATGCLGRDARVSRARRLAALVVVDIVRRDPLTKPTPPASTIAALLTRLRPDPSTAAEPARPAVVIPLPRPPAPAPAPTSEQPARQAAPLIVSGEDVSDYV